MHREIQLPGIYMTPLEEADASPIIREAVRRASKDSVKNAVTYACRALGFDSYLAGMLATDRRPDIESTAFFFTDQSQAWVDHYQKRDYLAFDPRVEMAGEPGFTFWEAHYFNKKANARQFFNQAAKYGIRSGLVVGLCTRDPPTYAMLALNRCVATHKDWGSNRRLIIAAQAILLGRILARAMRQHLNSQEVLYRPPPINITDRQKFVLQCIANGMTSKEIGEKLGVAKVTVDTYMPAINQKLGTVNRYEAVAKAIVYGLIQRGDYGVSEYKTARRAAVRRRSKKK